MDGMHGTNKRSLDLTIEVFVKNYTNSGFLVRSFLRNRLDQIAQEFFLDELRKSRSIDIKAKYLKYFKSNNDAKFYHACVKIMEHKPRRFYVYSMSKKI